MSADVARRRRTKASALVISLFLVLWLCGMANPSRVSTNAAAAGDASGSTASTGDVLGRALALIEDGEGPSCTFRTRTRGTSTWYFHVVLPRDLAYSHSIVTWQLPTRGRRAFSCSLVYPRAHS